VSKIPRRIELLQEQARKISSLPFYQKRFQAVALKAGDIRSLEDFQRVPLMETKDLQKDVEEYPPYGSLFHPDTIRMTLSPGPKGLMPVYHTRQDVDEVNRELATMYKACGVGPRDIAAVTFGYHLFIAGITIHGGFESLGCKTIPLGPGDSQRTAEMINRYGVTVLASNPSFALKLAQEGVKSIRVLFAGGEPFSSVQGYKERLRRAFGPIGLIDSYGLGQSTPVARECREERGLHVADSIIYLEIVEPETGKVLPDGERGEVVITHLRRQGSPLFRFRTGDLSMMEHIHCPCGRKATLTRGVLGRTDEMHKVKGVKLYPSQIDHILRTLREYTPGKYRVVLSRKAGGGDLFRLAVEAQDPGPEEKGRIAERIKETLLIRPDMVEFVEKLPEGGKVVDERY
jgi:phenylacetate-CoA ligase